MAGPVLSDAPVWAPAVEHTATVLFTVRTLEAAIYPEPFAHEAPKDLWRGYERSITHWPLFDPKKPAFEWDGDPWAINVIGHALLGSEMYVRARICSFGVAGSVAFTTVGTIAWEYAFEGNAVQPSALDLVYTPLAGFLLGEARFVAWRALKSSRAPGLAVIADPFGEMQRAFGTRC